jgi:murein L,D-transpeptidase YafK
MSRTRAIVAAALAVLVATGLVLARDADAPALPPTIRADSLIVEKAAHRLTLYDDGRVQKAYRVALGRGGLAAKQREGDLQVPEGRYTIDSRLEQSAFHRALHVSYPDSMDTARARRAGVPPGHSIMVHGIRNGLGWLGRFHTSVDWTAGCVALTNREIEELWRAVPDGTPIVLRP